MPGVTHKNPPLYHRIVKHLMAKGFSESHAWATANRAVAKGCLTGELNFPGHQEMNKGNRAQWCAAYAAWKRTHPKGSGLGKSPGRG
jgi:hypothetical protein